MIRTRNAIAMAVLSVAIHYSFAQGQSPLPTTLVIDLQDAVEYQSDISDPAKFATNPDLTPSAGYRNFGVATLLGDIVAINGQPARGMYAGRSRSIVTSQTPGPGGAIADVRRTAIREHIFEILTSDSTPVGTIISLGFSGGPAPPGTPSTERANWAIVGGTGAFLGARGQVSGTGGGARAASMAEDPSNRRKHGGTSYSFILHVISDFVPQIATTPAGPAVVHSNDFGAVTPSRPAIAGEILSLYATGLGPTTPQIDPGQPFPSSPLAVVNSPVAVTFNGRAAEVLAAVGYPGSTYGYQINFRVPPDIAKGMATVQISAAWIAGAPVSIAVQ